MSTPALGTAAPRRALVIGGGIGGLATAVALRQIGWDVALYERAPELREAGAGLSLWANAVRALDKLGIAAPIRAAATAGSLRRHLHLEGRAADQPVRRRTCAPGW